MSSNIIEQYNLFLPVNAKKSWLKCERRVLCHCVLAAVFHRFLLSLELACHWPEDFANCTPTSEKTLNKQRRSTMKIWNLSRPLFRPRSLHSCQPKAESISDLVPLTFKGLVACDGTLCCLYLILYITYPYINSITFIQYIHPLSFSEVSLS